MWYEAQESRIQDPLVEDQVRQEKELPGWATETTEEDDCCFNAWYCKYSSPSDPVNVTSWYPWDWTVGKGRNPMSLRLSNTSSSWSFGVFLEGRPWRDKCHVYDLPCCNRYSGVWIISPSIRDFLFASYLSIQVAQMIQIQLWWRRDRVTKQRPCP